MAKEQAFDLDVYARHIILFMGPGKSGKTTTAFNLFGRENTTVLSFDKEGLKPIVPVPSCFIIDLTNPWKDTYETITGALKNTTKSAILVDDLTHAGQAFYAYERKHGRHSNKVKFYGDAIEHMRDLMDYLKYNTDKHIIYTCTSKIVLEEDNNETVRITMPNVLGTNTFAQELPARVDHLFFMLPPQRQTQIVKDAKGKITGKEVKHIRKILTQSDNDIVAGNRMNQAGGSQILTLEEEVTIDDNLTNLTALRNKLLQRKE